MRISKTTPIVILVLTMCLTVQGRDGFKQYTDAQRRFIFDYPATMNVEASTADQVRIWHPGATLRINVFVEKRTKKAPPDAASWLEAFKSKLQEEMKEVSILEEGKLNSLEGSQGYIICAFKDQRGMMLVQLIQYYVSGERVFQMIISDKPEGFKNLHKVIRRIHESLRIVNPRLK